MLSQQVNRINQKKPDDQCGIYNSVYVDKPITDPQTGFINHPRGVSLEYKQLEPETEEQQTGGDSSSIGLLFQAKKYLKPGIIIEITISLRNKVEKFRGKVVMVRNHGDYFEIGLWLQHREDASRVRIVEQLCHMEAYFKEKKLRDGPYIHQDRLAEEWISKNAGAVPSL